MTGRGRCERRWLKRSWVERRARSGARCGRLGRSRAGGRANERGSAAFEMPLIVGLVLIPFGVLVLSVSTWVERQTAARDAAAETARFAVIAGPERVGEVEVLLRDIEAGYGLAPGSMRFELVPSEVPGEAVVSRVTVSMPGAVVPLFGSFGDVSWTAEHVERLPDYGATQ